MVKVMTVLRAKTPGDFRRWYCEEFFPALSRRAPNLRRLTLNEHDPKLDDLRGIEPAADAYDFGIEAWFDGEPPADFHREPDLLAKTTEAHSYRVEEMIEKGPFRPAQTKPSPGVKSFVALSPQPGMPMAEVRRHYNEHVPLALPIHIGMASYTRHWVQAALSPDAPNHCGFSLLHFPTDEDYGQRYYRQPSDSQIIREDVTEFLGAFVRLSMREYVLVGADFLPG